MKYTAGVFSGAIVSMLMWGTFALGWSPICAIVGIFIAVVVVLAMGAEFADHWDD